jgi:hypothetical protein
MKHYIVLIVAALSALATSVLLGACTTDTSSVHGVHDMGPQGKGNAPMSNAIMPSRAQ